MRLCKAQRGDGPARIGVASDDVVHFLDLSPYKGMRSLSDILHSGDPLALVRNLLNDAEAPVPSDEVTFLPPLDEQEVWAAGVTYKRSQEARERESVGAARFYDLVYSAPRPELFFKATARRVVGMGDHIRIRRDSRWSVPEPELTLVISPRMRIVGFTVGNDVSSRDIEGENPLYLPQAKLYDGACAIGPCITLRESMPAGDVTIRLTIERGGAPVFEGSTSVAQMARSFEELVQWLGRDNSFPHGALLLTGTGIVPPDHFSLAAGDVVHIDISGIGRLTNVVEQLT